MARSRLALDLHSRTIMSSPSDARRRHWADLVAIVAGVWSFGQAIWGPANFSSQTTGRGAGASWLAFGIGGLLAIGSVLLAQRYTRPARIALGVAGLVLVVAPLTYRDLAWLPIVSSVAPGLAMLIAAPFIGRMPRGTAMSG
jgi:hypothetical protein